MDSRRFFDSATLYATVRRGLLICLVAAGLGLIVNAVTPNGIPLFGPIPDRGDGIDEIGLEQAWGLYREGRAVFVDARSDREFRAGHIPGALFMSQDTFEEKASSLEDLIPSEAVLVTYCAGEGCESSREVAELLIEAGYSQVKVFFGGWAHWRRAGYPVESSKPTGRDLELDLGLQSTPGLSTRGGD